MMKTGWWSIKFELTMEGEEVRWDDLDEATQEHIAECIKEGYTSGEIVTEEDESYTAFIYEDDGITTADLSTYDDKEEAIEFAKHRNWDEVVNDITGEVIWSK